MRNPVAALLPVLLLTAACGNAPEPPTVPQPKVEGNEVSFPPGEKLPQFTTEKVESVANSGIRLNGRLAWDEERTVRIYTPLAGRVARIDARPGDSVRVGQPLALLASPEFGQAQAEARRATTDVTLAQRNFERQRELEAHGVTPRKDLQIAEAEQERARAELDRARARLRLYGTGTGTGNQTFAITSPLAGVVVERNINPGQELRPDQANASAPLFVVTNPDHLWAVLDASESELRHLRRGKMVKVRSAVYPDQVFEGRIANVSDALDPATRTLKVRVALANADRRLKGEMFVTGEIAAEDKPHVQVPTRSVFFQGGKHFLFTAEGEGRYTRREIQVGDERGGGIVIVKGLEPGQQVVTEGALMLQQTLQPRRVQK